MAFWIFGCEKGLPAMIFLVDNPHTTGATTTGLSFSSTTLQPLQIPTVTAFPPLSPSFNCTFTKPSLYSLQFCNFRPILYFLLFSEFSSNHHETLAISTFPLMMRRVPTCKFVVYDCPIIFWPKVSFVGLPSSIKFIPLFLHQSPCISRYLL